MQQKLKCSWNATLSCFKTATFVLRQESSLKKRLICWIQISSMSPDMVPPCIWPLLLPRARLCIRVPDSAVLLWLLLIYGEGSMRQLWQNSPCHGKRTVMLRGKLGFSITTLSSAWCSNEWGLIGSNPVETRNRAEKWGAGENWDWSGRNRRHQTCKILSLRGRE